MGENVLTQHIHVILSNPNCVSSMTVTNDITKLYPSEKKKNYKVSGMKSIIAVSSWNCTITFHWLP